MEATRATFETRHNFVTHLTSKYYRGDIIPPTTRARILNAQKYSVIHHYTMTAVIFVYGMLIPVFHAAHREHPRTEYYGFDLACWKGAKASAILMGIILTLLLLRLCVMSMEAEFYQIGLFLVAVEAVIFFFVGSCLSFGLPALLVIIFSNLLNVAVSQIYWRLRFKATVMELQTLVPPSIPIDRHWDYTNIRLWGRFSDMFVEWYRTMGFTKVKTLPQLYEERCGVFGTKEIDYSHTQAMQWAYEQALNPGMRVAPWGSASLETYCVNAWGLLDGSLTLLVSNTLYAFAGVWTGKALFENFYHGGYALGFSAILIALYAMSMKRTWGWLAEAVGVAVAEKEWLAHDVVKHTGEREEVTYDVLDTGYGGNTADSPTHEARAWHSRVHMYAETEEDLKFMEQGRLNLVHLWLCVATVAESIGESHLARLFWNTSVEARYMTEAVTYFEFKLYYHSKWEVMHKGTIIRAFETLLLAVMTCFYFGTFFYHSQMPIPLVSTICAVCFVASMLKLMEALHFVFSILGRGDKTMQRHTYVSEWVVFVIMLFVLINVVIWLYLLPIMKHWDLPVGHCHESVLNRLLFPLACHGF